MKVYIFGLIVITLSCIYYDYKIKKLLNDSDIIFSSFSGKYNMLSMIVSLSYIFFFLNLDIYIVLSLYIMNYISFYRNRLVIHSDGVILKMKNYKYKKVKFYKICVHSRKKFKLMLLIYDKNKEAYKKIYKNVVLKCEYRDEVVNAFKGNVAGELFEGCNIYDDKV